MDSHRHHSAYWETKIPVRHPMRTHSRAALWRRFIELVSKYFDSTSYFHSLLRWFYTPSPSYATQTDTLKSITAQDYRKLPRTILTEHCKRIRTGFLRAGCLLQAAEATRFPFSTIPRKTTNASHHHTTAIESHRVFQVVLRSLLKPRPFQAAIVTTCWATVRCTHGTFASRLENRGTCLKISFISTRETSFLKWITHPLLCITELVQLMI